MKECCVIAAVGCSSLHREWISKTPGFDLHLIVFDDAYESFRQDAPYVTHAKGYKFRLLNDYLTRNGLIQRYKYFYFPDDDILIDTENIHKLFWYMESRKLDIAQPAVYNYYISHPHTLRRPHSKVRYTSFVEIMQPCFSREALKKVQFTFALSDSGWGIDFHWARIAGSCGLSMAIVDDVISVHTRPVRSNHSGELSGYLRRYGLENIVIR